jgi:3-oxoacyl-[acyl-carrier protein] reductase
MNQLSGKVAIVTGASKGIGAGIARRLGAAGAAVVVNYASSRSGADQVVAEIRAQGGRAIAVQADVASSADVQRLFRTAVEEYGRVDVVRGSISSIRSRRSPKSSFTASSTPMCSGRSWSRRKR